MIEFIIKFFQTGIAHAQPETPCTGIDCGALNPTPFTDVAGMANSVLNRVPYFLGGLALLAIIYSGAMYIFALGDATKIETAKKNFSWTLIGVIAVSSIYMVISLIVWLTKSTPLQ